MNKQISCKSNFYKALHDLISSFAFWRIFCLIGINDIRKRYARSKMGQFWIVLSLAINIGALGLVYSLLFKVPLTTYLPFIAVGMVFWTFISTSIAEGANLFIGYTSYIKELNIPKLSYVNSLFVKNIIIFFHNVLVLIPVYLIFPQQLSVLNILLSLMGFIITSGFLYAVVMFIAVFSLRFRDFPNIIASLIQLAYYVTPIMWNADLMPQKVQHYLILNPFAVFLSVCRDPLLGLTVKSSYWIAAIIYTILPWVIAFPFYSRFRSRIVYWL